METSSGLGCHRASNGSEEVFHKIRYKCLLGLPSGRYISTSKQARKQNERHCQTDFPPSIEICTDVILKAAGRD